VRWVNTFGASSGDRVLRQHISRPLGKLVDRTART
jgi:hypothetical protein